MEKGAKITEMKTLIKRLGADRGIMRDYGLSVLFLFDDKNMKLSFAI
jgi:hypothetical protein